MTMNVGKLIEILDAYDPHSLVKVFDHSLNELSHIDKVIDKGYEDGVNVILCIKED
jgi:hypothetical protein